VSKQLSIDEMLDAMHELGLDSVTGFENQVEQLASTMAETLADALDINCGEATYQGTAFAGTCAPFWPKRADQPVPECIEHFDVGADWEADDEA
jgi:hypothetical protein